ncbi:MAG: glycosyltransferase family 2 protein [Clostridiaceae bacterium]|nr:glycosyltransferase family 2 protein [Clostridiaceae bacterium]
MIFYFSLAVIAIAILSGFLMMYKLPSPGTVRNAESSPESQATTSASTARKTLPSNDSQAMENGPETRQDLPSLTIIIPARNEQMRLPNLLSSLAIQDFREFELIVVDDQSEDETASLAKAAGAKVIRTARLEEGSWIGKSFACWTGALAARGEWLLFLDADTRLEKTDSLRRLMSVYGRMNGSGVLSLQPYHQTKKLYESFSAIFNIIVIAGMNSFTPWRDKFKSAGSFGPCIMLNREEYFRTGGHSAISGAVMDDLALGVLYQKNDLKTVGMSGRGLISFRMYPEGFRSLFEGWTKSFGTASSSTHPFVFTMIIAWISGGFSTVALLVHSLMEGSPAWIGISSLTVLIYMVQLIFQARRTGNFNILVLILYPLQHIFFTVLFMWSLYMTKVLHTVNWRGRKIKV